MVQKLQTKLTDYNSQSPLCLFPVNLNHFYLPSTLWTLYMSGSSICVTSRPELGQFGLFYYSTFPLSLSIFPPSFSLLNIIIIIMMFVAFQFHIFYCSFSLSHSSSSHESIFSNNIIIITVQVDRRKRRTRREMQEKKGNENEDKKRRWHVNRRKGSTFCLSPATTREISELY